VQGRSDRSTIPPRGAKLKKGEKDQREVENEFDRALKREEGGKEGGRAEGKFGTMKIPSTKVDRPSKDCNKGLHGGEVIKRLPNEKRYPTGGEGHKT